MLNKKLSHVGNTKMRSMFVLMFAAMATLAMTAFSVSMSAQTPTPACTPSWVPGPNVPPDAMVRSVGVYFPTNGRFYAIGGRSSDAAGNDFTNPFEYDPATNAWVTKSAVFPDNEVNNMACGVLTMAGTPQIICVGGNAGGATSTSSRVFSYNPVTDTITVLGSDTWPGNTSGTILPGGFAVFNNKLYTIGGFNVAAPISVVPDVWQFDPSAAAGSRWTSRAPMPSAKGYVPATVVGNFIYTTGGAIVDGTVLADSAESFRYDPVANTWASLADIPRATGETRAITIGGEVWVLGGGRTPPNPSNEINIYNPGTNTWRLGPPFVDARRNFPADSDGSRSWIAGGYNSIPILQNTMEIFNASGLCATPTPTPVTPGPTPTPLTPAPTPTPTINPSPSPSGSPCPASGQNFDGVTPPALPAGWAAISITPTPFPTPDVTPIPAASPWIATTTLPDTPPNAAFVSDPDWRSDKRLESPLIAINSPNAQLTFRNRFDTEFDGVIYWDGGVLEISSPNINGGAFTDITDPAVGGGFVTGGYTGQIYNDTPPAYNVLAGRSAWSGNSGGYINTVANLGPNVNGQSIRFRFRFGSDEAVGSSGWWVDTVLISGTGPGNCPTPSPIASPSPTRTPTPSPSPTPPFDFDGDHKTDISIWRASAGQWWLYRSTAGIVGISFGESNAIPRAADYTGDRKTDVALYRPLTSEWLILRSENFTYYSFPFGSAGDIPVPGDYDGDGRADAAVYRPSLQLWFILRSSGGLSIVPFGLSDDVKVPADYDGDGKTDIAVYRPSVGQWWYIRSRDGQVVGAAFGVSTDKTVPGDYTGDGKTDIAVFRPSDGNWYILRSEDLTVYGFPWGDSSDKPAPGDYDGDGKFDPAVFRPSDGTWYILRSSGGISAVPFGLAGDTPVPGQAIP